jgi:hypothetical protein
MIGAAVSESWAEGKRRSGATLTPSPWDFGLEWRILACSSLDQNDHAGAVLMPPWCRPLPLRMAPNCERGRGTALQVRSGVLLTPGQSEPAALPPRLDRWHWRGGWPPGATPGNSHAWVPRAGPARLSGARDHDHDHLSRPSSLGWPAESPRQGLRGAARGPARIISNQKPNVGFCHAANLKPGGLRWPGHRARVVTAGQAG